jgi:hypothetical protein
MQAAVNTVHTFSATVMKYMYVRLMLEMEKLSLDEVKNKRFQYWNITIGYGAPVELRRSKVHGMGVFATRDIKVGEFMTFFPSDVRYRDGTVYFNDDVIVCEEEAIVLLEMQTYSTPLGNEIVSGCSLTTHDPFYLAHYMNDGACASSKKALPIYSTISIERMNGLLVSISKMHVACFACKAVKKGDEIFIHYGPDYWGSFL